MILHLIKQISSVKLFVLVLVLCSQIDDIAGYALTRLCSSRPAEYCLDVPRYLPQSCNKEKTTSKLNVIKKSGSSLGGKATHDLYVCDSCGVEHIRWVGRCTACNEWNTVKPFKQYQGKLDSLSIRNTGKTLKGSSSSNIKQKKAGSSDEDKAMLVNQMNKWVLESEAAGDMVAMDKVDIQVANSRISLFSHEVNRVLGGGLVPGSVLLLAGEPGIGKSTILIQVASHLAGSSSNVVYLSGEETVEQVASRAHRLQVEAKGIFLMNDVDIDAVLEKIMNMPILPSLVIVDSIQTIFTSSCSNSIGSVTQIRESAARLVQFAKSTGVAVLIVGHVTKSGDVAGPRVLEHMVDTVLNLEGSDQGDHRVLRSSKNRFGSTTEIGIFAMTSSGMQDVMNPSEMFLSSNIMRQGQDGSAVVVTMEGTRPILVEVQCLVGAFIPPTVKSSSRRTIEGYSIQRLLLICAVIEKNLKLKLYNRDIYVNIVGGLRISETAADLAVAVTLVSSYLNLPIKKNIVFIGEIGLGGELRSCRGIEARIQEAKSMGFDEIIIPRKRPRPWNMQKSRDNQKDYSKELHQDLSKAKSELEGTTAVMECGSLREALCVAFEADNIDILIANNVKSKRSTSRSRRNFASADDDDEEEDYEDQYED